MDGTHFIPRHDPPPIDARAGSLTALLLAIAGMLVITVLTIAAANVLPPGTLVAMQADGALSGQ